MKLNVGEKEYKVKFGYNSFCDTDLLERTEALMRIFTENEVENDSDVASLGKVKELFCCIRELMFVGFRKYNPVETLQEVGNIIDDYIEEETEEDRSIMGLFGNLTVELLNEGFLKELLEQLVQAQAQEQKPKARKKQTK